MVDRGMCSNPEQEDAEIKNLSYNRTVRPGDNYKIDFDIESLATIIGDTITVIIIDEGTNETLHTTTFKLPAKGSKHHRYEGTMPDRNVKIGIALWDINTPLPDDCEDVKRFTIKKGKKTTPQTPDFWTLDWYYYVIIGLIIIGGLYFLLVYTKKGG